jgi:hypothetical protein
MIKKHYKQYSALYCDICGHAKDEHSPTGCLKKITEQKDEMGFPKAYCFCTEPLAVLNN